MIASLTGTVEYLTDSSVVINAGGIGFEVQTGMDALQSLGGRGKDETVHLYTYLYVGREGEMTLYGFLSREELRLFKMLITVSGIGPKGALSMLSAMSAEDLIFAILTGDTRTIARAPGIGKKTAERLVLELRDRLARGSSEELASALAVGTGKESVTDLPGLSVGGTSMQRNASDRAAVEAAEALTALGYARPDAVRAVKAACAEREAAGAGTDDTEELLRGALRFI